MTKTIKELIEDGCVDLDILNESLAEHGAPKARDFDVECMDHDGSWHHDDYYTILADYTHIGELLCVCHDPCGDDEDTVEFVPVEKVVVCPETVYFDYEDQCWEMRFDGDDAGYAAFLNDILPKG